MEHDREDRELSGVYELTLEEAEAVSGGCGMNCCLHNPGPCPCN